MGFIRLNATVTDPNCHRSTKTEKTKSIPQPQTPMGSATAADGDTESATSLLISEPPSNNPKVPQDSFHLAYIIYFTLGAGYLLPWNAFITAVDYFTYLYPDAPVDRVFAIVYMTVGLIGLILIIIFELNFTKIALKRIALITLAQSTTPTIHKINQ